MMVFPDDQVFQRCKSAPAGSRVFYLKFQNNRREFFWMQEPDASKDDEVVNMVNTEMNGAGGRGVRAQAVAQTPGECTMHTYTVGQHPHMWLLCACVWLL